MSQTLYYIFVIYVDKNSSAKYVFAEINRLLVEAINDFNVAADLSVWLALKIYELVEKRSRGGTLTNTRTGQMLIIMEFVIDF